MAVDYEYNFVKGLYRAKIKTTYKRPDMSMNDFIYSDPYKFRSIRKSSETILLDTSKEFVDDVIQDATRYSNGGNHWRIEDYILEKTWNYYTAFYILNSKIDKGSANKLILDLEGKNLYSTADLWVQLSRTMPNSWSDALNNYSNHLIKREVFIHGTGHDLPRQIVEISLDDVTEPFHLSFMSADIYYTYVRYIEFNGSIEIIN